MHCSQSAVLGDPIDGFFEGWEGVNVPSSVSDKESELDTCMMQISTVLDNGCL